MILKQVCAAVSDRSIAPSAPPSRRDSLAVRRDRRRALLGAPTPGRFGVADGAAVCSNAAPSAAGDCTAPGFPPPAPSALADVARSVALSESSILRTRERVRQASVQPSLDGPDSCSRTRLSRSARAADSERIALAARDRRPTPTHCLLRTCPFSSIRSRAGRASHRCCGCRCRTRHQKATTDEVGMELAAPAQLVEFVDEDRVLGCLRVEL